MTQTALIRDVDEPDFETLVLERSHRVPVVVDFWAEWCGPCRALGPVLERAVTELEGKVELARIDTDRNQSLAQRYRVRGIPAVKAFSGGTVVDEFVGVQGPEAVRAFLERLVPSEASLQLAAAKAAQTAGDHAEAERLGRMILSAGGVASDVVDEAALLVARELVARGDELELETVLARVEPLGKKAEAAVRLRELAELSSAARRFGGESAARAALERDVEDLDARFALAGALAARDAHAEALEHLLELVTRSRAYREDGARRAMLTVFAQLGTDSELARSFRRRLQVVL